MVFESVHRLARAGISSVPGLWLTIVCGPLLAALGACTSLPASAPGPTAAHEAQPAQPAAAVAGEARAQAPPAEAPTTPTDEALASARRSVRSTTEWLARGVDGWFGSKPFSAGGKVSDGRLGLGLLTRQNEKPDFSVHFDARFRLPNIDEKAYLFLGRTDQREIVADKPDAFTRQQALLSERTADRSFFAGLGLLVNESVQFRLGLHGGLKPYAQVRWRQPWQLDSANLLDLRETLFWTANDRIGSTTALSYEHAFSSTLAGRWLGSTTITQRLSKFEWSSSVGAFKSLGDQRLLSLEALFSGVQGAAVAIADYGLQAKWEQPIHQDWLLGQIVLGHFRPRPDLSSARGHEWALGGIVTMKF